ncbi:MAG: molecular chaperone TorD family protein [Desulfobulbus sp.]|nr:molecular chaperone TorD family protein [Desulfobulbus sp.]
MPGLTFSSHQCADKAAEANALSQLYSFLALTMHYPDPKFCNTVFFEAMTSLLESLGSETELTLIQNWLHRTQDPLDELKTAYTLLFITAGPSGRIIPPYASVYRDGNGTLQGKSTEQIRDFYRRCGFDIADTNEPADHLRFQLHFLAALAGEGRLEDEQFFLQTFFRPWFKPFQKRFMQEARHPFYTVSIQLIDFFTKEEQ